MINIIMRFPIHIIESTFLNVEWESIFSNLMKIDNSLLIFLFTIIFIAISFKKVSMWNMAFTMYLKHRYSIVFLNAIVATILALMVQIIIIIYLTDLNIYIVFLLIILSLYILFSFLITIGIILVELYNAGNQNKMNEKVIDLFKKDFNIILETIDKRVTPTNHSTYYYFLEKLDNSSLVDMYEKVKNTSQKIDRFEIEVFSELLTRKNCDINFKGLKKDSRYAKYVDFIKTEDDFNVNLLLECASIKLEGKPLEKLVNIIIEIIDSEFYELANINNPNVQDMYMNNKLLIDKIILRCLNKPNKEREKFIIKMLNNAIQCSAVYIEDDIIKIDSIENPPCDYMRHYEYCFYYQNNTKTKNINFKKYNKFIQNIKNKTGIELLEYLQQELVKTYQKLKDIEGAYKTSYTDILSKFEETGNEINLFLNTIDRDKIDINKIPFYGKVDFISISYSKFEGKDKEELVLLANELKEKLVEANFLKTCESPLVAIESFERRITVSNELGIEIFLRIYEQLIEEKHIFKERLSKDFFISYKNIFYEAKRINKKFGNYLLNINFYLNDIFINKYGKNVNTFFNFSGIEAKVVFQKFRGEKSKLEISYKDVYNINKGISFFQYYVDNEELPIVKGLFSEQNTVEDTLKYVCTLIKGKYESYKRNDFSISFLENYTMNDFEFIKYEEKGLFEEEKIRKIYFKDLELKYEKRTVFAILILKLLNIKTPYYYDGFTKYEDRIDKLLNKLDII